MQKSEEMDHLVYYMMQEQKVEERLEKQSDIKLVKLTENNAAAYFENWKKVGLKWKWNGRLVHGLEGVINDLLTDKKQIFHITKKDQVIGVAEFIIIDGSAEIIYFGLMEEHIGKGSAHPAFITLLHKIYDHSPKRIWLHTCSFDAPQARAFYRKYGFRTYKIQKEKVFEDF